MRRAIEYWERLSSWLTGVRMGEPYVPQGAHQRFLIEALLFLGQELPTHPSNEEQHHVLHPPLAAAAFGMHHGRELAFHLRVRGDFR